VVPSLLLLLLLSAALHHADGSSLTPLPSDPPAIKQVVSTRAMALPYVQRLFPPISQPPWPGKPAGAWETMQHSMLLVCLRMRDCGASVHPKNAFGNLALATAHYSTYQGHCVVCCTAGPSRWHGMVRFGKQDTV
jgi:hypothetical protein